MLCNPFNCCLCRRNNGPGHVCPDFAQGLLDDGQGRLRQFPDIGQNVGAQLRQEVGAQVLDHLNVIGQGVGLLFKCRVCRSGGFVHFGGFAGQVFGLVPSHGQDCGLCLHRGEQARKRQFVVVYGAFQRLQRALQALAFKQRLAALIAHAFQGCRHILGRGQKALHGCL